jgi:translation initiation factor IF-3
LGVVSREQAFFLAYQAELDLLEVNQTGNKSVVRMVDVGKERYEQEKRARKQRALQKSGEVKEIKLSFRIDKHDFETKINRARRMMSKGDRIKIFMRLVGRENAFVETAKEKIKEFADTLGAQIESIDKQGNRLTAILK